MEGMWTAVKPARASPTERLLLQTGILHSFILSFCYLLSFLFFFSNSR